MDNNRQEALMAFVTSNDEQIYYQVHSRNGTPIMLLPGLGAISEFWFNQIGPFSKKHTLITMDNRGSGRSAMPDEPYTMEIFADDVAAVLDAENIDKCIIVGASMGGMIAQEFFHRYPDRVEKLILCCTGVGPGDSECILPEPEALDVIGRDIPNSPEEVEQLLKDVTACYFHPSFQEKHPEIIEMAIKQKLEKPQPDYAHKHQLAACFNNINFSERLNKISVPTLIIHGEADKVWPLGNAQLLADRIPNTRLEVLKETATMINIERVEEFNTMVLDFIDN